jgi:hypothetical protein
MAASSLALGLVGIAASFAPSELLRAVDSPAVEPLPVLIQLLGGMYLAFALMNWTAKDNIIGGIYSRPLSLGNSVHFLMGSLALAKQQSSQGASLPLVALLIVYVIFAICFLWLVFGGGPPRKVALE